MVVVVTIVVVGIVVVGGITIKIAICINKVSGDRCIVGG